MHSATQDQRTASPPSVEATELAVLPRVKARAITPRRYRAAYGIKRRVDRRFFYSGEDLPGSRGGCDLLVCMGLPSGEEARQAMLRQAECSLSPTVLVGVGRAGRGERDKAALSPDRFLWSLAGRPLALETPAEWDLFLTGVLEKIYRDTPRIPRCSAAERRRVTLALLAPEDPVVDRGGPVESALVDAGLLEVLEDRGSYRILQPAGRLSTDSADQRLLASLLEFLYGDYSGPAPSHRLDRLQSWMASPPRGLRADLAALYLALALRYHGQDVQVSRGSAAAPLAPTLLQTGGSPVTLHYRYADRDQQTFLRSVGRLLGAGTVLHPPFSDLWERVHSEVLSWFAGLPVWTRACPHRHSPDAQALLRVLEVGAQTEARSFLGEVLPAAFGTALPPVEAQSALLDRIEAARQELDAFLQKEQDRLAVRLAEVFASPSESAEGSLERLDAASRGWWARLHPDTGILEALSEGARGLREAVLAEGSVQERWFDRLPTALGLGPLGGWERDQADLLVLRTRLACLELEQWPLERTFPLPEDSQARRQALGEWVGDVLRTADLAPERSEALLFDLLDELAWQE